MSQINQDFISAMLKCAIQDLLALCANTEFGSNHLYNHEPPFSVLLALHAQKRSFRLFLLSAFILSPSVCTQTWVQKLQMSKKNPSTPSSNTTEDLELGAPATLTLDSHQTEVVSRNMLQ